MTLGEKISLLRKERGLTQADLGNELGVTYQAVSKWERDDSMPDFDMISKLAKLFGVSIAYFENNDDDAEHIDDDSTSAAETEEEAKDETEDESEEPEETEEVVETVSPILGVCTVCGKYVKADNVAEETPKLVCNACHAEQIAKARRAEESRKEAERAENAARAATFNKRAIIAAVVAGVIAVAIFIVLLVNLPTVQAEFKLGAGECVGISIATLVMLFTWIFQLFFDGVVRSVTLAGLFFIKLPGIIFSADLDGLIFLLVMKILFFIITVVVFIGAIIVTSLAAMFLSLITFVPVIIKILRRNEDIL